MNLELSEEQIMLRDTVRRFADRQLETPIAADPDRPAALGRLRSELNDLGLWSLTTPEDAGGFGLGALTASIVVEELARRDSAVATLVAIHLGSIAPAVCASSSDLRDSVLDGSASIALLWPGPATDDAPSLHAQQSSDGWKLSGDAVGVGATDGAEYQLVVCPIGPIADKTAGYFLLKASGDNDASSFSLGLGGLTRISRDIDETVAADALLLKIPTAATSAATSLGLAATAIGVAHAALDEAMKYAQDREQFGRSLNQFQAIRFKLSDMATGIDTARWAIRRAAASSDSELADLALRSSAKAALFAADEALQIHGGYGYTEEYPVERLYRDSRELSALAHRWLSAGTIRHEDR